MNTFHLPNPTITYFISWIKPSMYVILLLISVLKTKWNICELEKLLLEFS